MTDNIKVMLVQHGSDGCSLWYPEIPTEDERGVVHIVRDDKGQELYFRTGRGFECFYREEALQDKAFEMYNE